MRRVVEQHHGRINVASQWKKGTTVIIQLPLALPVTAIEHKASGPELSSHNITELAQRTS